MAERMAKHATDPEFKAQITAKHDAFITNADVDKDGRLNLAEYTEYLKVVDADRKEIFGADFTMMQDADSIKFCYDIMNTMSEGDGVTPEDQTKIGKITMALW